MCLGQQYTLEEARWNHEGTGVHSSILPGESHGQRSLAGYGPQGCKELDTTEATEDAHTHAHMLTNTIPNCWMWKTKQLLYYYTDISTFQEMEGDLTRTTL